MKRHHCNSSVILYVPSLDRMTLPGGKIGGQFYTRVGFEFGASADVNVMTSRFGSQLGRPDSNRVQRKFASRSLANVQGSLGLLRGRTVGELRLHVYAVADVDANAARRRGRPPSL